MSTKPIDTQLRDIIADLVGHCRFVAINFDIHYEHLHEAESILAVSSPSPTQSEETP